MSIPSFAEELTAAVLNWGRQQAEYRDHWLGMAFLAAMVASDRTQPASVRAEFRAMRDQAVWKANNPPPMVIVGYNGTELGILP